MFQRILVVLEDFQSRPCVFSTALRFAQANHAHLCLVDRLEDLDQNALRSLAETARVAGIPVEISEQVEQTDQALIQTAQNWGADLIVMGHALDPGLIPILPCTVLIIQQENHQTISMTMQLKPQASDGAVRHRLERLLDLTPSS